MSHQIDEDYYFLTIVPNSNTTPEDSQAESEIDSNHDHATNEDSRACPHNYFAVTSENKPCPCNYIHFSKVAPLLFHPEDSLSEKDFEKIADLMKNQFEKFYAISYKDTEELKLKSEQYALLHKHTNWSRKKPYPRAPYSCVIPMSECGTEELEIVAAMVKLQSWCAKWRIG